MIPPKKPIITNPIYGVDYDGWALPLARDGGPPYWSHFVGSSAQPSIPKGCVKVKISEVETHST